MRSLFMQVNRILSSLYEIEMAEFKGNDCELVQTHVGKNALDN